jgi:hypothetical protein
MAGRANRGEIPWTEIKTDYICGRGSYRTLAEKYGLTKDQVARRSAREAWARQRDATCDTIAQKTLDKAVEKISDTLSDAYSDQAAVRARIKSKLLTMAENWIDQQEGQIHDAGDYRRIVQCCMDMLNAADSSDERSFRVVMEGEVADLAD